MKFCSSINLLQALCYTFLLPCFGGEVSPCQLLSMAWIKIAGTLIRLILRQNQIKCEFITGMLVFFLSSHVLGAMPICLLASFSQWQGSEGGGSRLLSIGMKQHIFCNAISACKAVSTRHTITELVWLTLHFVFKFKWRSRDGKRVSYLASAAADAVNIR